MTIRKNVLFAAALAVLAPASVFSGPFTYKEASAPWSSEAAAKLVPRITPDFLKGVEKDFGPGPASALSEKKDEVSALLKRFKACELTAGDVQTADKYLDAESRAAVAYFAGQGCASMKEAAAGHVSVPQSASLTGLNGIAASGALSTYDGSARFFDGAFANGPAKAGAVVLGVPSAARPSAGVYARPAISKPISSVVPALETAAPAPAKSKPERPADIGEDGMVHQAVAFWSAVRKDNWRAYKDASTAGGKAKALMKASAGAAFGGVLFYSNLENVETEAAKLGWDAGAGASAGRLTADSARLAFHCGITFLALAPIPMLKAAKAVIAGKPWAIAVVTGMTAGVVNRYIYHFAD
jgi:hypothetical protein